MTRHRAFSLVELVVVVVILGTLAAIALPRVSAFGQRAQVATLKQNLAILSEAVGRYHGEHLGTFPSSAAQLTQYTDEDGNVSSTKTTTHIYGPYLDAIPPLPVGTKKGETGITADTEPGTTDGGWVLDTNTGTVRANLAAAEVSIDGEKFNAINLMR